MHEVEHLRHTPPAARSSRGGGGRAAAAAHTRHTHTHTHTHTHQREESLGGATLLANACGVELEKGSQIQMARGVLKSVTCVHCSKIRWMRVVTVWIEDDTDIRYGLPLYLSIWRRCGTTHAQ
jgi:hypothetical protein